MENYIIFKYIMFIFELALFGILDHFQNNSIKRLVFTILQIIAYSLLAQTYNEPQRFFSIIMSFFRGHFIGKIIHYQHDVIFYYSTYTVIL